MKSLILILAQRIQLKLPKAICFIADGNNKLLLKAFN